MRSPSLWSAITRAARGTAWAGPPERNGAWQTVTHAPLAHGWDGAQRPLAFSATYACCTLIASDIGKLAATHTRKTRDLTWTPVHDSPQAAVLRRPNRFQVWQQFMEGWVLSKLTSGNTYALKQRDGRGVVVALYLMDPAGVTPLVAEDGSVFYRLMPDNLSGLAASITVPAAEVIHDRMSALFHPLVGIPPLFAATESALQGLQIQQDSKRFFAQGAKPSGILTTPGRLDQTQADSLRDKWERMFTGNNAGRVAVLGGDMKYTPIRMTSVDAQQTEQLRLAISDVARCFRVPLYMIGAGEIPAIGGVQALRLHYLESALQSHIEAAEALLTEGLDLPIGQRIELDETSLLRMDSVARADANEKAIRAGYLAPNEARLRENLPPVAGGGAPFLQQQHWSLEQLANRQPPKDAPSELGS